MTEDDSRPLMWKGEEINEYGKQLSAVTAIAEIEDEKERADAVTEFKQVYIGWLEAGGHDDAEAIMASNIGYLSGYSSPEGGEKIRQVFQMAHPVFGMGNPDTPEALAKASADLITDAQR